MKKTLKKFVAAFLAAVLAAGLAVQMTATAAPGTLGTEEPFLFCEFIDQNGDAADGNTLTAGDYQVNIVLSGMADVSVMQFTADYATENSPVSIAAVSTDCLEEVPTLSLGGVKNENGTLVAAYASTEEAASAVDSAGTVLATLDVTVSSSEPVDFRDYFRFNADPDLTFAEADYGDGIEDAYVLDTSVPTAYSTYLMTADESPENELEPDTITVSGKILIASDAQGESGSFGLRGVKVYAYDNENNVIAETVSNASGDAATWGDYSLEVPVGTTAFMVGDYAPDTIANRPFTIAGDADVTGANVPVVMCDYNDDGFVNTTDTSQYGAALRGEYYIYADFNNDGNVNTTDTSQYGSFLRGCKNGVVYATQLTFE
jgi:hypothetical protein